MPAPISQSPHSASPAPTTRMSFLVQLFLGGSVAAVVLFLGVIIWRLAHLPHSGKAMAERPTPVQTAPPAVERPTPVQIIVPIPLQPVVEIGPRKEDTDVVPKVAVSVSEPDAKAATVDLPPVGARSPDRVPPLDRRSPAWARGRPSVQAGAGSGDPAPTERDPAPTEVFDRAVAVPVSEPEAKAATVDLPRAPEPLTADQIFEQRLQVSEDDLRQQLCDVPELRLLADENVRALRAKQEIAIRNALQAAVAAVKEERMRRRAALAADERYAKAASTGVDRSILNTMISLERDRWAAADREARRAEPAFTAAAQQRVAYEFNQNLQQSMQQAARRAGLTLMRGPNCRLLPNEANSVAVLSKELRDLGFVTALAAPSPRRHGRRHSVVPVEANENEDAALRRARIFQKWCDQHGVERLSGAVPTLAQMLQIEDEPTRLLLVRELARIHRTASTDKLADRAIMDLSPEVRRAAVAALSRRDPQQYVPILMRGLRYPWSPVADHAAVALRTLKPQEAVAPLVDLLDRPSPSLPVLDARTQQYAVPELVRLNHMRSCLLCHAISANKEDGQVRGLVPTPGLHLPRSSSGGGNNYYEAVRGDFVRADTTFVHQDFSIVLLDKDVAPWPLAQRYDFLTRLRPVPPELANGLASSPTNYPQRDAVLYALRGITGRDGGDSSDKWRQLLGIAKGDSTGRRSIRPVESGITTKVSTPP